jgi:hypothetical protein
MVERRALLALLLATTMGGSVSAASATSRAASRPTRTNDVVASQVARFDGPSRTLRLVRDRLIMGIRISLGVLTVDLSAIDNEYSLDGMQDGPDGVDPLGAKDQGLRTGGPIPLTSSTPVR